VRNSNLTNSCELHGEFKTATPNSVNNQKYKISANTTALLRTVAKLRSTK